MLETHFQKRKYALAVRHKAQIQTIHTSIMSLTNKEKMLILISQALSAYSVRMQEGKIQEHQSVIDFILKNMPKEFSSELSMDLIDDVFSFISNNHMELS